MVTSDKQVPYSPHIYIYILEEAVGNLDEGVTGQMSRARNFWCWFHILHCFRTLMTEHSMENSKPCRMERCGYLTGISDKSAASQ